MGLLDKLRKNREPGGEIFIIGGEKCELIEHDINKPGVDADYRQAVATIVFPRSKRRMSDDSKGFILDSIGEHLKQKGFFVQSSLSTRSSKARFLRTDEECTKAVQANDLREAMSALAERFPDKKLILQGHEDHLEEKAQRKAELEARLVVPEEPYNTYPNEGWQFVTHPKNKELEDNTSPYQDWKIHISTNSYDTQKKLAKLAMDTGILTMKFIGNIENINRPKNKQHGKTAVFYCSEKNYKGEIIDWEKFITQAEEIVQRDQSVGPRIRQDRPVPGTAAIFYRHDRDEKKRYLGAREVSVMVEQQQTNPDEAYNAHNVTDPFKDIVIGEAKNMKPINRQLIEAAYIGTAEQIEKLHDQGADILVRDPATGNNIHEITTLRHGDELVVNWRNGEQARITRDALNTAQIRVGIERAHHQLEIIEQLDSNKPEAHVTEDARNVKQYTLSFDSKEQAEQLKTSLLTLDVGGVIIKSENDHKHVISLNEKQLENLPEVLAKLEQVCQPPHEDKPRGRV